MIEVSRPLCEEADPDHFIEKGTEIELTHVLNALREKQLRKEHCPTIPMLVHACYAQVCNDLQNHFWSFVTDSLDDQDDDCIFYIYQLLHS